MPKCQVTDAAFEWGDDAPSRHQPHDTVIYETHVRGLTMRHPGVPEALRGTFPGLARHRLPQVVGVTAIELLPVQAFLQDRHLVDRGLSLAFFAPEPRYLASRHGSEFKAFVKAFHAGLEVILNVVYNHAEGSEFGRGWAGNVFGEMAAICNLPRTGCLRPRPAQGAADRRRRVPASGHRQPRSGARGDAHS